MKLGHIFLITMLCHSFSMQSVLIFKMHGDNKQHNQVMKHGQLELNCKLPQDPTKDAIISEMHRCITDDNHGDYVENDRLVEIFEIDATEFCDDLTDSQKEELYGLGHKVELCRQQLIKWIMLKYLDEPQTGQQDWKHKLDNYFEEARKLLQDDNQNHINDPEAADRTLLAYLIDELVSRKDTRTLVQICDQMDDAEFNHHNLPSEEVCRQAKRTGESERFADLLSEHQNTAHIDQLYSIIKQKHGADMENFCNLMEVHYAAHPEGLIRLCFGPKDENEPRKCHDLCHETRGEYYHRMMKQLEYNFLGKLFTMAKGILTVIIFITICYINPFRSRTISSNSDYKKVKRGYIQSPQHRVSAKNTPISFKSSESFSKGSIKSTSSSTAFQHAESSTSTKRGTFE